MNGSGVRYSLAFTSRRLPVAGSITTIVESRAVDHAIRHLESTSCHDRSGESRIPTGTVMSLGR